MTQAQQQEALYNQQAYQKKEENAWKERSANATMLASAASSGVDLGSDSVKSPVGRIPLLKGALENLGNRLAPLQDWLKDQGGEAIETLKNNAGKLAMEGLLRTAPAAAVIYFLTTVLTKACFWVAHLLHLL
jgi:hypothetical protein